MSTAAPIKITVKSDNRTREERFSSELETAISALFEAEITPASAGELGQVVFVDERTPNLADELGAMDRKGRAIFLIAHQDRSLPEALAQGWVDDVLVYPFRPLEVLSRLNHFQQIMMWDEVKRLNESFSGLLIRLHEDLKLAERLQKSKQPLRFPDIKGMKVTSRYLAGMRSGGDHFDLAEGGEGGQLSIVLSDSSSYGLSSAVLAALMRITVKLSSAETRSSSETVRRISDELKMTLGEKDRLSLFYGVLSRKDYRLKYLNLGTSAAFYRGPGKEFVPLSNQGLALTREASLIPAQEGGLVLEPEGRLVLISDGFVDAFESPEGLLQCLGKCRDADAAELVNELVFKVKSRFTDPDDMPEQDCSAIVLDVDSRVIRLASEPDRD